MWLFCPKCNHQINIGWRSRYDVFSCDACACKFRGFHAKPNELRHTLMGIWNTKYLRDFTSTPCPFCRTNLYYNGGWPSVCPYCTRDLPTGKVVDVVD